MKNAMLLLLLIAEIAVGQKKFLPIKVLDATSQHWVAGAPGGKTGTKYVIKIYVQTDQKLEFVNLWIGERSVPADIEFFAQEIQKRIQLGDSLLLTYNHITGETIRDSKPPPFKYKGAALIEARIQDKPRFFIVKKIRSLADLRTK